jgi:hypothetical protein
MALFTQEQLHTIRQACKKLSVSKAFRENVQTRLNAMSTSVVAQLAGANIRIVSGMARDECAQRLNDAYKGDKASDSEIG